MGLTPGGDAPMALGVLWGLTGLTFIFVLLRLYTRLKVLQAYGWDDYAFNFAFVLFVTYDIMLTLAAHHGFGRNITDITDPNDVTKAILYQATGSTVLVVGTVVSKTSQALFLLRLVVVKWHKILILFPVIVLGLFVVTSLFVFWFACKPIEYLWDRFIPGSCPIDAGPISTAAGAWSVVVDFWYVAVPWLVLWNVQMAQREKMVINISMSLGVIAGACGIKRAMELHTLSSPNFTKDTSGLVLWHAAELSVTMICIGIPVCRPLYKGWLKQMTTTRSNKPSSNGYSKNNYSGGSNSAPITLRTIGGGGRRQHSELDKEGAFQTTRSIGHHGKDVRDDDASDDAILGPAFVVGAGNNRDADMDPRVHTGAMEGNRTIWVQSDIHVQSSISSNR